MPAPDLRAPSMSSARVLRLVESRGTAHRFVYCADDCIAYARVEGGRAVCRARLGASAEVWRLAFHEFGCMDWPVVSADEFDKLLPTLRITT